MRQRIIVLCLIIPIVLVGFVVLVGNAVESGLAQSAKAYLRHNLYRVEGYIQAGEALPYSPEEVKLTASINPTETIWEMLAKVDQNRAMEDLRRLTGEDPLCINAGCYTITHRLTGSDNLSRTMEYLYENLVPLGFTVEFRDWSLSGLADRNLIAKKTGVLTPTEEIYLVAHVDGVKRSDEPFPAADDNASSVVNGLELARVLS
ncbi:MAG: M28 family peptidase, partial [bacterium]